MIETSEAGRALAQGFVNRVQQTGVTFSPTQRRALSIIGTAISTIGWSRFYAVYPFMGATAATHALDMMGGFDVTWSGGVTHDSNGITGNGTTGYGDTSFTPSSDLSDQNSFGFTLYNRTATRTTTMIDIGGTDGTRVSALQLRRSDDLVILHLSTGTATQVLTGATEKDGIFVGVRRSSSDNEIYKNGASIVSSTTASTGKTTRPMFLLAYNNNGSPFLNSNSNLAFASIHTGLTANEVIYWTSSIQAAQTLLSR